MAYILKGDGIRVTLSVLVGASPTLVGLKLNNSAIISMQYQELYDIVLKVYGTVEHNHFTKSLSAHHILPVNNNELIVLETIHEDPSTVFDFVSIPKALRLYHGADIYSCYDINYRSEEGEIRFGGLGDICKGFYHAKSLIAPCYKLTEQEKNEFPQWYKSTFLKINAEDCNDNYKAMIRMYDTSYLIGICESEYIMLFTVLEMLFGTEYNDEITKHIARGTSKLFGGSAKERRSIRNQMYKLYDIRSRYVHEGKKVPYKKLFELRDIVRRVLIEIFNRNYHTKDKTLKELGYNL